MAITNVIYDLTSQIHKLHIVNLFRTKELVEYEEINIVPLLFTVRLGCA